jgi:hypothetical protein
MRTKLTIIILTAFVISVFALNRPEFTGYLTRTGQLQIGNAVPAVDAIYINNLIATADPSDIIINPVENSTRNVTIKITMEDANGNCDTFTSGNGTAYLCSGVVDCNPPTANHTVSLVYNSTDGQWGSGNKYCNMSGISDYVYFYELNGTWTVNVTVTDGINTSTPNVKNWTYGELAAFGYAPGGTVNMGTLNLESWNNGTGQQEARNTGNIILNMAWNATNFTGQSYGDKINISNNYKIDDDTQSPTDTGNLPEVNIIPNTNVNFYPASGLLKCTSMACSNTNATMQVYWHIYIPIGLKQDTYTNSIEVTSSYH